MTNKEVKLTALLKVSGEALGENRQGFDRKRVEFFTQEIKAAMEAAPGTGLAIIIGGGNIMRGNEISLEKNPETGVVSQPTADYIGMNASTINGMLIKANLSDAGIETVHMSALGVSLSHGEVELSRPYNATEAHDLLKAGTVVVLSGGTGKPGVSTDSGIVMLASEMGVEHIIKGTKVNGVYSDDPRKNPNAEHLPRLSHQEFAERNLSQIFDQKAVAKAAEKGITIQIFDFFEQGNTRRALQGEDIGSMISSELVTA